MSNVVHKHRHALLTGCILVTTAVASTTAHADKDGVVFDSVFAHNINNGSATGNSSLAISNSFNIAARATADESMAVGNYATASSRGGIAIGSVAQAGTTPAGGPIFDGNSATPTDANTAIGFNAVSSGNNATAVGGANGFFGAQALGDNSAAYGTRSKASGDSSVAVGLFGTATGAGSVAIGGSSNAGGTNRSPSTLAVGFGAQAGAGAAGQSNAAAFGSLAKANATAALALGLNANASQPDSVALGSGSIASAPNTLSIGSVGRERRIVNVGDALHDTEAVNLRQVRALIAAGPQVAALAPASVPTASQRAGRRLARANAGAGAGVSASGASSSGNANDRSARRNGVVAAKPRQPAASRVAMVARGPSPSAAVASMSCELGGASVSTAVADHSTSSSEFSLIQQSGVSFNQGGAKNGCVTLSFSAEALAPGDALMEVRAVLDGNIEASPGAVYFAQGDDVRTRTFNFVLASVAPGPHRIEMQFRNAGENGTVRLGNRTTMVQFAR